MTCDGRAGSQPPSLAARRRIGAARACAVVGRGVARRRPRPL